MYICICNAVTDRTIREAASRGQTFAELSQATGCSDCCGSCTGLAHEIFDEARGARSLDLTLLPLAA